MGSEAASVHAQEELLPFLLYPRSYPHQPRQVRLVQTHASSVFIAPPFVYKIKKPVNFGFLNFSTLARRRYFCVREVQLNQRLCPDMYLEVIPITRTEKGFAFGGRGDAVGYVVRMRQLSGSGFMDKLLERQAIASREIGRIVAALQRFYDAQDPTSDVEKWGEIRRLKISTDENFRQAVSFVGGTISRAALDAIRFYTNKFYRRHAACFRRRVRDQRIRDCHGDLHLEHIHITPQALHIYDCIEFNDRLRYVDVASDVAFLAMDLDYEGREDLSREFVAAMSAALRDPAMLRLMDFYKCYRSFVRGKVESLHSVAASAPEAERTAAAERARRYFRLALRYAVAGSGPSVCVVMGRIASGKTTVARMIGQELNWRVYSSDRIRKEGAGFPLFERSSVAARRRLYSDRMTTWTYRKLMNLALADARRGQGSILDATFARRQQRNALRARLARGGTSFCVIEVKAPDATVRKRLAEREQKHDEISDARLDDFDQLTGIYEPPTPGEKVFTLRTTGSAERAVRGALRQLVHDHLQRAKRAAAVGHIGKRSKKEAVPRKFRKARLHLDPGS